MTSRFRALAPLAAALSIAPGCDSGPATPATSKPTRYSPRTDGSPEELLSHLRALRDRFKADKSSDSPKAIREGMHSYTDAVVATAEALIYAQGTTLDQRREAAEAEFVVLERWLKEEPGASDQLMAVADRLEAEPEASGVRSIAAFHRAKTLLEVPPARGPAAEPQFDRIVQAALRLGRAEPPYPKAAPILANLAMALESRHRDDQARELYQSLAERYAAEPAARFAAGNAARLALKSRPLDDFAGPNLDGSGALDLKSFRGKVVLIDFWATWCKPCRAEMPELKALRERLGPRGFEILGVTIDQEAAEARPVAQSEEMGWPQIHDAPEPTADAKAPNLAERFGASAIPLKILIDREGRVAASGHSLADVAPALSALLPPSEDTKK